MLLEFETTTYATENLKPKQTPDRHKSGAIRITRIEKDWCSGRKHEAVSEVQGMSAWSQRS